MILDSFAPHRADEMTRATRTSWKTLPAPEQREPLEFAAEFSNAETELLVMGLIPKGMEDKWFVYFDGPAHRHGWLLFHRSWTGACIYGIEQQLKVGDVIGVQYEAKKTRCKVIWVVDAGGIKKTQVGVQLVADQE